MEEGGDKKEERLWTVRERLGTTADLKRRPLSHWIQRCEAG